MTYESNLMLESKMVIHGSNSQTAALGHIKNALGQLMRSDEEPSIRIKNWEAIYKYMMEQEVHLSPTTWLEILEDEDIGSAVENRDERYKALLKSMPHKNGHPMRVCPNTFTPLLYIDGEWVGIEVISDPEPDLVEQQQQADEVQQLMEDTEAFLAKVPGHVAEAEAFMAEVEADLNYDDAMRVVNESK